jgi:hypothetical protein
MGWAIALDQPNSERGSPIIHPNSEIPSYIRVNLRPSAVKKDRSPFLILIQKGSRPSFIKISITLPFVNLTNKKLSFQSIVAKIITKNYSD